MKNNNLPIGLFDSGVGGLTVLAAMRRRLPGESVLYLGDTARLPYGAKSPATIRRYALQCAEQLVGRGIKMLVVACNTASAVALPVLMETFPLLPVLGVVEPGAAAGCLMAPRARPPSGAMPCNARGNWSSAASRCWWLLVIRPAPWPCPP